MKLTLAEYNTKLACLSCCLADKACTLLNKLNMGIACEDEFTELKFYSILLEVLRCYTIDDSLTEEEQDLLNPFSYELLEVNLERFTDYCGIC